MFEKHEGISSPVDLQNQKTRAELLEILAEADEDVKLGRVRPMKDTFDDLKSRFT